MSFCLTPSSSPIFHPNLSLLSPFLSPFSPCSPDARLTLVSSSPLCFSLDTLPCLSLFVFSAFAHLCVAHVSILPSHSLFPSSSIRHLWPGAVPYPSFPPQCTLRSSLQVCFSCFRLLNSFIVVLLSFVTFQHHTASVSGLSGQLIYSCFAGRYAYSFQLIFHCCFPFVCYFFSIMQRQFQVCFVNYLFSFARLIQQFPIQLSLCVILLRVPLRWARVVSCYFCASERVMQ